MPPSSRQYFVPGVDLTPFPAPSGAQIETSLVGQSPAADCGLAIYSAVMPNFALYPETKTFLWCKSTDGSLYYFDGATFSPILAGVTLPNGSVTIGKLSITGGAAGQIIRVKSDLSGFEFVNVTTAIAAGSLAITAITPSGSTNVALATVGGVVQWVPYSTIAASGATFPSPGADGTVPIANAADPKGATWGKINLAAAVSLQGVLDIAKGGTGQGTQQDAINALCNKAGSATGDIFYYNGTNWIRLARGTNGQLLQATAGSINWASIQIGLVGFSGHRSVDLTLGVGNSLIDFDVDDYNDGNFNHGTGLYTAPFTGLYMIAAVLKITNQIGSMTEDIEKNAASIRRFVSAETLGAGPTYVTTERLDAFGTLERYPVSLAAGDTIGLRQTVGTFASTIAANSRLTIYRVG